MKLLERAAQAIERPVGELGRFFLVLWRVLYWTPRRPFDLRQLVIQMVRTGVDSLPVMLLTALFTGAVLALQSYTVLARFNAEGFVGSLVALALVLELSPVVGGLIIAGRVSPNPCCDPNCPTTATVQENLVVHGRQTRHQISA